MELTLYRSHSNENETIGALYVNKVFECFILEDEFRTQKIKHETRIRAGRYKIVLRTEGRIHEKYKQRFSKVHSGVLHLTDTPEFTYIYIHCGNTDDHTSGCLLTGRFISSDEDGTIKVERSTEAYLALYKKIIAVKEIGEEVWIRVIDKDDHCVINSNR